MTWLDLKAFDTIKSGRSVPNELLGHEWHEAEALWLDRQKITDPVPDPVNAARLKRIFYGDGSDLKTGVGWDDVNEAERVLAQELTVSQLDVQYPVLFDIATRRKLSSLGNYPALADFATKSEGDKRALYITLLYSLQSVFIESRHLRSLRNSVSKTLFNYGVYLILAALIVPLIWLRQSSQAVQHAADSGGNGTFYINETVFALAAVATSGALGAYFSRAMRFQTDLPTLTFETVMQNYVARMLRLRILYGTIGAIVFYFIMRGEFVGGNLFPTLAPGMISEQTTWTLQIVEGAKPAADPNTTAAAAKATAVAVNAATVLSPTGEFAKLLVWSFLAGFSERLVPDTLTQLEKKSDDAFSTKGT